ncbi:MAG: RDD family protein, partial [Flavobacteriales bacterium]|nr:RDD family protein [Flavobacteriales bacterium]
MEHVRIETAQNVVVDHEVAPLGDRIVAYLLDTLVLVAWVILMFMLMAMIEPDDDGVLFLVMMAMIIFPFLFYHLVMELSLNGQSIGKRVRKIKVSRLDGGRPSFGQYLLRWVLRPIDSFYYIGLVVILINGRGQRLGDLAAGTTIVSL